MANNIIEAEVSIQHIGQQNLRAGQTEETYGNSRHAKMNPGEMPTETEIEEHIDYIKNALPPAIAKMDDAKLRKAMEYEVTREARVREMRQNPTYQFIMLVAGFCNERMDTFWKEPTTQGAAGLGISINRMEDIGDEGVSKAAKFHNWYVNTPWADMTIFLSPMVYAHIEEAHQVVQNKWDHLKGCPLSGFVESMGVRNYFARLVAFCIKTSVNLSSKRYHLMAAYGRINKEKMKILNIFRHVHGYKKLTYDPEASHSRATTIRMSDDKVLVTEEYIEKMENTLNSYNRAKMNNKYAI